MFKNFIANNTSIIRCFFKANLHTENKHGSPVNQATNGWKIIFAKMFFELSQRLIFTSRKKQKLYNTGIPRTPTNMLDRDDVSWFYSLTIFARSPSEMFVEVLCITWPYSIKTTQIFCEFALILYNLNNPLCAFLYVSENLPTKGFSTFAWTRAWELWLHMFPGEVSKIPRKAISTSNLRECFWGLQLKFLHEHFSKTISAKIYSKMPKVYVTSAKATLFARMTHHAFLKVEQFKWVYSWLNP